MTMAKKHSKGHSKLVITKLVFNFVTNYRPYQENFSFG